MLYWTHPYNRNGRYLAKRKKNEENGHIAVEKAHIAALLANPPI